ncbi:MAG: VOC family protein [Patescibacteria group bacterium]
MSKIHPSIRFNDQKCREGMNFYKECFGGELEFMTGKGTPMESDMTPDQLDLIMHSTLTKGSWVLIGSDMMRDKAIVGDNVGIMIDCESEEEIRTIFSKLSDGAEIFMPIEEQFWGALYGVLTDKYGVEWMLNYTFKK